MVTHLRPLTSIRRGAFGPAAGTPKPDPHSVSDSAGEITLPSTDIAGATAVVTGASRGFGRGIAAALSRAGAQVFGVARDHVQL
jgi:hypothetical protein